MAHLVAVFFGAHSKTLALVLAHAHLSQLSILFLGYGLVILSTLLLLKILRVVMEFLLYGPSERYLVFEVIFDVAFVLN